MPTDDTAAAGTAAPAEGTNPPPPVFTPDGPELLEHLDPPLRRHGYFRRPKGLAAFAESTDIAVIRSEISMAVPNFPLAFREAEDGRGKTLVALLGLHKPRNLFLSPDEHEWLASYLPAWYRRYPFYIRIGKGGRPFLSVDASGEHLLTNDPTGNVPLFGSDGMPSEFLTRMNRFANRLRIDQRQTDKACRFLDKFGLLEEWPVRIALEDGEHRIDGYFRVNETAFVSLPNSRIIALRDRGVLPLIYGQLFSMRNLSTLSWMHRLRERQETLRLGRPAAEDEFLLEDFDHFQFDANDLD